MKKLLRHITSNGIERVIFSDNLKELSPDGAYWLELKSDNLDVVIEYLTSLNVDKNVILQINDPGISSRSHILSDSIIINLPVSNTNREEQIDYLTVFATDNLIITILNEQNDTLNDLEDEMVNNPFDLQLNLYLVLYFMISEILQMGMENAFRLRKKVNSLAIKMDDYSDTTVLKNIIYLKREIGQASGIVEDQYHILGFVPKFNWNTSSETENFRTELDVLFRGFNYLLRIYERQEDKLEALHVQYQLLLHEKGNKKLNTLTVVQAIFVPLTLLAGIYGMNFKLMPELNWSYGYFILLGIMGFITLVELWWFKKKGWFD